ncbi:PepSY domain-containing protein [Myxococcus sp. K15C18031901]|uniref:PepSY-associated TM helix domain-containing protein n=1 Tax=Myxococcus dinghuensis TaxID=2906761 RepID=UPI0020A8093D|nr:PepSY-associated TM helix domain-containing protein [Myxococcus dinghuensis]MCP3097917.1 PepSY domain-containing protein [Myxococcus dinghuensis]
MRLKSGTYRILWEAHAWAGAVASVLLVGMFLLGVVSLFRHELMPWQEPRLRTGASAVIDEAKALETLQGWLDARAGKDLPTQLDVDLPAPYSPWLRLEWKEGGAKTAVWLEPGTGEQAPEQSDLSYFLFLVHFLYPLPGGMFVAGLVAIVLLLVVGTGLVIQVGRFRKDLVRFRPREALRTMWGDLHKVLGSVGLPYQAVMAWTAAIICINAAVLQPVMVRTAFDGNLEAGLATLGYPRGDKPSKQPAEAPRVATVLARAREALPGVRHYRFSLRNLGDASAYVDVRGYARAGLHEFTAVRVSQSGEVRHVREAGGPAATAKLLEAAYVLHSGLYAGMGVRLAYALLGIFSALCVVTGNLVWLERRSRSMRRVDVALARFTAGGCGGAAFALAAAFLANQLLPEALPRRPDWEHGVFYASWCACVLGALVYPRAKACAQQLLGLSGAIFVVLPWLDAWRHARRVFDPVGSPYVFCADVGLALLGAMFLVSAWVIGRISPRDPRDSEVPLQVAAHESR